MNNQRGQILVIILLVMLVGLTMGLLLFARTTGDISMSTRVEQSTRAFAAAEAGIEQALTGAITGTQTAEIVAGSGIAYTTTVTDLGNSDGVYVIDKVLNRSESTVVWLIPHNAAGALNESSPARYTNNAIDVCWNGDAAPFPALVITLLYKQGGVYKAAHAAYDPQSGPANNFQAPDSSSGTNCGNFKYRKTLSFSAFGPVASSGINAAADTLIALRITPLYASTKIAVDPPSGAVLPKQGIKIVSEGTAGTTHRKVEAIKPYNAPSSLFDGPLTVYGGGAEKN